MGGDNTTANLNKVDFIHSRLTLTRISGSTPPWWDGSGTGR